MSRKYDYKEAVKNDVMTYINENYDEDNLDFVLRYDDTRENLIDELEEKLWIEDSVTGNASGSYTMSYYVAEEYLCHNLGLLCEAMHEFGNDKDILTNPEYCDVTIRCYMLNWAIKDAVYDIMIRHEITDIKREDLNWHTMEDAE